MKKFFNFPISFILTFIISIFLFANYSILNSSSTLVNSGNIVAHAASIGASDDVTTPAPAADGSTIKEYANKVLTVLIVFGVLVVLVMTPYIGFLLASGDPGNIKAAYEWIQSLIYGLVLLALSGTIIGLVGSDVLKL